MGKEYRTWDERRQIIRAAIAESSTKDLESFGLSEKELLFFRARAARAVDALARKSSTFKEYYSLPTEKPFARVVGGAGVVIAICVGAAIWVFRTQGATPPYPIYAALISIVAVAAGWVVTNDVTHRNTIRQNTNNMIFARFAQAPFGDALHRFHDEFGYGEYPRVTAERMAALRASDNADHLRIAAAVSYILNYYEFVASGVLRGDLNARSVRENIRGVMCYYYDKCAPHIDALNQRNPRTYEHLRKIRTSYREA